MKRFLVCLFLFACPKDVPTSSLEKVCAPDAPPKPEPVVFASADAGCPAPFLRCLTTENATALVRNIRATERYAQETYIRCGPLYTPDAGVK